MSPPLQQSDPLCSHVCLESWAQSQLGQWAAATAAQSVAVQCLGGLPAESQVLVQLGS